MFENKEVIKFEPEEVTVMKSNKIRNRLRRAGCVFLATTPIQHMLVTGNYSVWPWLFITVPVAIVLWLRDKK